MELRFIEGNFEHGKFKLQFRDGGELRDECVPWKDVPCVKEEATVWTKKQLEEHISQNVKDYGAAVVVSALYKKLYGELPKIGLSGEQASYATRVEKVFP